jgi:dihydropteroate synthase
LQALRGELDALISIDTSKPEVMLAAVEAGAGMINDVYALRQDGAMDVAVECNVPVCLMHMQGQPRDMQESPSYEDVVGEVISFLEGRAQACLDAGMNARHIIFDPGFGFGKSFEQNLELFKSIPRLVELGYPLLIGVSRKTMLGTLTGKSVDRRMVASVTAAALAAAKGASILRVHDVAETVDALRVFAALSG